MIFRINLIVSGTDHFEIEADTAADARDKAIHMLRDGHWISMGTDFTNEIDTITQLDKLL